ncbi:hypothetical protein B5E58_12275 [Tyzzerella sp. An114]|uniref:hypothetical protein n=1 Tax=Tyzzerella sp. An114 TaxID=1965545 RepID=UPI000B44FD97|nr:hypothetical protein [Tyzzerella sp. An114]OUQ55432.1 hypothetical protein B5E58_12275 [Tyzzerella sp. An114]
MKKSLLCIIISTIILNLLMGCSSTSNDISSSSTQDSEIFVEDISLSDYLDKEVYQRMISEPLGADPPKIPFFNKEVVCILNYNGLAIFDIQTGQLKNCINIQKLGFGDTQGTNAILVRGNDEFITITTTNDTEGYIYSIKSDELGRLKNEDNMIYTEVKRLEQVPSDVLDLSKFDNPAETVALESENGILIYYIPMNDLEQIQFQIYEP